MDTTKQWISKMCKMSSDKACMQETKWSKGLSPDFIPECWKRNSKARKTKSKGTKRNMTWGEGLGVKNTRLCVPPEDNTLAVTTPDDRRQWQPFNQSHHSDMIQGNWGHGTLESAATQVISRNTVHTHARTHTTFLVICLLWCKLCLNSLLSSLKRY